MSHTKFLTYICHTDTFSRLFMLRFSTCDSPQAGCSVCQESLDQTPQRICVNVNTPGFLSSVNLRLWSNIHAFTVMFSLILKPDKCVEVGEESFWRHLLYSSLNAKRCGQRDTWDPWQSPPFFSCCFVNVVHHFTLDCCHVLVRFRGIKLAPVTVHRLRWS